MPDPDTTTPHSPLAGITVVDLGQIYQGPYCTLLMAKAGARVVKIEPPGGEPLRRRKQPGKSAIFSFAMLNSNKQGITLNLKSPRGRELLIEMVRRADVLLENFSPGTMDNLGVGWDVLSAVNPKLIYATGSGFGITGPDRDNLAMDFTIQAASGVMSITGMPNGPPIKAGPTVVDMMGGIHLYAAILTALFDRERTGQGRLVEVAMQEAVYCSLASAMEYKVRTDAVPPRIGNGAAALNSAPYNAYPSKDGWVAIHVVTEQHFKNLLRAMGRAELADDPRFCSNEARVANIGETDSLISAWTSALGKHEVAAICKRERVPCAPVRDVAEVMDDAHMLERGFLERFDHPEFGVVSLPTTPLRLHGTTLPPTTPSGALGACNDAVYGGWLGLSAAEIAGLRAEGVI